MGGNDYDLERLGLAWVDRRALAGVNVEGRDGGIGCDCIDLSRTLCAAQGEPNTHTQREREK